MVTGSVAAGFFSLPRTSADIDIVIDAKDSVRPYLAKVSFGTCTVFSTTVLSIRYVYGRRPPDSGLLELLEEVHGERYAT
jgi:hypothetical protein